MNKDDLRRTNAPILDYFSNYSFFFFSNSERKLVFRLCPTSTTILNAGNGHSFVFDFIPFNKQSKLLNFQIHDPVRATVMPITHDEPQTVNWCICNGQLNQSSSKIIIFLQTFLRMILIDVLV